MTVPFEHTANTNMHAELDALIKSSSEGLANRQKTDGHWQFELEADATMPAEYIFFMHYMDEIDVGLEQKLCVYLLSLIHI